MSISLKNNYEAHSLVPLHSGYPVQPQNSFPAFLPVAALRIVIGLPQLGQAGAFSFFALASVRQTLILPPCVRADKTGLSSTH